MKTCLVLSILATGLLINVSNASARSLMPPIWDAELTRLDLDENFPDRDLITSGRVGIHYSRQEAALRLERGAECPEGAQCFNGGLESIRIVLPIVSMETDDCGNRHIVARRDSRMGDGPLEVLEIHDHTRNHCPTLVEYPATEVSYDTELSGIIGRVRKTHSTFAGKALRPVYTDERE
jgi:hypothetical protein